MQINAIDYFEKGALLRCRDKVAVIDTAGQYTFAQLERFAKNLAALLIKRGDFIRRPVPVFLPKSMGNIVANVGILYSGNAYANLDIKSPVQRVKGMLDNLAPKVIVTSAAHIAALAALGYEREKLLFVEDAMVDETLYENAALLKRLDRLIDTDPYCIIHTSGSTGIPKGVGLNHRSTIDFIDWSFDTLNLSGNEVMASLAPIYFDAYTLEFWMMLSKGSTWVVVPDACATFPAKLVEFITKNPINFIFWVPTIMVNIANQDLLTNADLSRITKVFFIGEVFPTKHLNYWRRHLPQATFVNLYGPIEIVVACTYYIVDREFSDDERIPVGFPMRNTEIIILNDENKAAKLNEPGEVCVRGSSLALGYWNNHERTGKGFVQNPLNPHHPEMIYRTGDSGFWNERGEVMLLGRKDFQIKHLGYRIELGEIEHAVLQIPGFKNACVVYNHEKKEIVLFYETEKEQTAGFIREKLGPIIPKYMMPTVFTWMEQMPRNPNGKIDRAQLVARVNESK
ncbi:MAG: amino acid adenylation domain-containing protein [Verrucomicrobia bacterium]|nr:amino acid adenylation domain-containing protein [Verrucomicrobiota bacterium]